MDTKTYEICFNEFGEIKFFKVDGDYPKEACEEVRNLRNLLDKLLGCSEEVEK